MTAPASSTVPVSALSWPQMQLNSVVLPAPLGPTRPTLSPNSTSKVMWLTAAIPPNDLDTSSTTRSGGPATAVPDPTSLPSGRRPLSLATPDLTLGYDGLRRGSPHRQRAG